MRASDADLRSLERRAFSRFYDDGLVDVLLGSMLILVAFGFQLQDRVGNEAVVLAAMFSGGMLLTVAFKVWRTHLLRTRLGRFTPGPERRRRIAVTRVVLLGTLTVGICGSLLAVVAPGDGTPGAVEVLLPVVFFLVAAGVLGVMAQMLDVARFALHGVLLGLAGPLLIWPDAFWGSPLPALVAFGVPAVPMIGIGLWKLAGFLRDNPPVEAEEPGIAGSAG